MSQLQQEWEPVGRAYATITNGCATIGDVCAVIGGANAVISEQMPRIMANNTAHVEAMLREMENRLAASITEGFTALRNEVAGVRDDLNDRIDTLTQAVQVNEHNRHARALNASVNEESSSLHPLVRPNGDQVTPGLFPATYGEFRRLEGQRLTDLLIEYELNVPAGASRDDRLKCLAQYCAAFL